MAKLAAATHGEFHLSTDGFKSYPVAVRRHLGHGIDHDVMQKISMQPIPTDYTW
jgi:hypothetical protein